MIVAKHQEHDKVPIIPDFARLSAVGGKVYNPEENYAIYRACIGAAKYMETYGQAPAQPQIDLSHYITSKTKG